MTMQSDSVVAQKPHHLLSDPSSGGAPSPSESRSYPQRLNELTSLFNLSEQLQAANSPEETYQAGLDAIIGALGCPRASILLFDETGTMRFVAWRGLSGAYRAAVDGHSPWTASSRAPVSIFVRDILESSESDELKSVIAGEGIRALAFIPLTASGRIIGKFMAYHDRPHEFEASEIGLANTIARQLALAISRQLTEHHLRESESRFRVMSEHAPVMMWVSDPTGKCLHLNRMLRGFWGIDESEVSSFTWSQTIHPEDAPRIGREITAAMVERRPISLKGRYRNSAGEFRILETTARPWLSATGELLGMIGVNVDATEREEAEQARETLVAELNHRVKNTLAMVQGIAYQTFKNPASAEQARVSFEGRLMALSRAHNALTKASWKSASLEELAYLTLEAQGASGNRVSIIGPPVLLPPKSAVSIAMALHELSTNAMKYGALSDNSGRIIVSWSVLHGALPQLMLNWSEVDGPPVDKPARRGFGTFLLEKALARDLDGEVKLEFGPGGVLCTIHAPLPLKVGDPQ